MSGGGIFLKNIGNTYVNQTTFTNNTLTNTYPTYLNGGGALTIKNCTYLNIDLSLFE